MRNRVFWKFFAGFFLLSAFLVLAFYALVIGEVKGFYLHTTQESLLRLGRLLGSELASFWPRPDEAALARFIQEKSGQAQVRLTVIDPQGRVLADSQEDPRRMQNHADRPEVAAALSGHPRTESHYSFTLHERMMYHALPLKSGERTVGALRLSQFIREIDRAYASWRWRFTSLLLALVAISLFLSFLLSRNLTRPIRDLALAARRVAGGHLDSHVLSRRRDEIGELAGDFNAMIDSQKAMLETLQRSQNELEAILGSVSDGLLVIDAQERVVRAGPRASQIIGETDPTGRPYWEFLRSSEFADLVRLAAGKSVRSEIEIHGRTYLASLSPLPAPGGTVITFHDLSESKRLERQKKDFVANVSHELRTPLTAIKGYAETMAEDATGAALNYLDVIRRHTDRLIGLTQDLLSLAELEEKGAALSREAIDWPALLAGVRVLFEKKLREKKLNLDVSLPDDPQAIAFRGDRFRLEQMLINLLDNAVRYTEKGGIAVRLAAAGGFLRMEVQDSGPGIAPEHLPRIFERFYVADRARSRQNGGTGLGLAIVKHIAVLHGGEISVRSDPGAGSTFTVLLPLTPR
jgi:two-component system phosphate regulon sensor histidine kinase PhoR